MGHGWLGRGVARVAVDEDEAVQELIGSWSEVSRTVLNMTFR